MALPNYQVDVISCSTGRVLTVLDSVSFYSMRYSKRVNDVGVMVLVLPYTDKFWEIFGWDNFMEVRRTSPLTNLLELEESYFVRARHHYSEGDEERLVIGGLSLAHLLMRRVVNPADDPAAVDGYSKKAGAADTVIQDYVREQMGDLASAGRAFPGFTVETVEGSGSDVSMSFRYDNLFNAIHEIVVESGMDYTFTRTDEYFISMDIRRVGTDRTKTTNDPLNLPRVILAPERGNLSDPSIKLDRTDEKNYVYALGQGQGEQRLVVESFTPDAFLTPFNRIEFVKDARNVDKTDSDGLVTAASAALNENKAIKEFTFIPKGTDAGSIYNKDWFVGDKVTTSWRDEEVDLRIGGIEIEIDGDNEVIEVIVQELYND